MRDVARDFALAGLSAAISVLVIVSLFVWPGFLSITHCVPANGPTETVNGRTYCMVALTFPAVPSWASFVAQCHNTTANHTVSGPTNARGVWGFAFRLNIWVSCTLLSGLDVTIVEPNASTYSTSIGLGLGNLNGTYIVSLCLSAWITPEDVAGVSCNTTPQAITANALIEAGK